jgi:hypothetical protein
MFADAADRFIARQENGDGIRYFEIKRDEAAAAAKRDEEAVADEHAEEVAAHEHAEEVATDEHAEEVAAHEHAEVVAPKKKTRGRVAQLEKLVAAKETEVEELKEKLKAYEDTISEVEEEHAETMRKNETIHENLFRSMNT